MGGLTLFSTALALATGFESEGAALFLGTDGQTIEARGRPPDALLAAQRAFLGSTEGLDDAGKLQRRQRAPYRALRAVVAAPGLMARELLVLRVQDLVRYPIPSTVRFTHTASGRASAWSTSRAGFQALLAAKVPAFSPGELEAAGLAVEMGRAGAREMGKWLDAKKGRDWALDVRLAHVSEMPAYREGMKPELVVGELLDALGCEIGPVELHEKKEGTPP